MISYILVSHDVKQEIDGHITCFRAHLSDVYGYVYCACYQNVADSREIVNSCFIQQQQINNNNKSSNP